MTVSDWLRAETPRHLTLLSRLRERLEGSLDEDVAVDENGHSKGTPSRDWCRAFARYQQGYEHLLVEERERAKLALLAKRAGAATLTDEEYELEIKQLAKEAVRELPIADLAAEFLNRGMSVPVVDGSSEDD